MAYLNLIHNLALLVALSLIHQLILRRIRSSSRRYQFISGLIFGGVAVVGMLTPVQFTPGVIFDARSVVLAAGGMAGGPITALVAAVISIVSRAVIGGGGTAVGIAVIAMASILGSVFYILRQRHERLNNPWASWLLGVVVHLFMLWLFTFLPDRVGYSVVRDLGVTILITYPIATMLLFGYFRILEQDVKNNLRLQESEAQFKRAMESNRDGVWDWNLSNKELYYSPGYLALLGFPPEEHQNSIAFWQSRIHPDDLLQMQHLVTAEGDNRNDSIETELRIRDVANEWHWMRIRGRITERDAQGLPLRMTGTHTDVTERKHHENILAAQHRLADYSHNHSVQELLTKFLDEAEILTDSEVGFYHFVNEDQEHLSLQAWSTNTTTNMCQALGSGFHYPLSEAGVWIDGVRDRQPVIHNDYQSLPHKKGLPEGHAPIIRELIVPVLRSDLIVAVLGVGNKSTAYTNQDVQTVQRLADLAWEIVTRRRSEELNARLKQAIEQAAEAIVITNHMGQVQYANPAYETLTGHPLKDMLGKLPNLFCKDAPDAAEVVEMWDVLQRGETWQGTLARLRQDGTPYFEEAVISPVFNNAGEISNLIAVKRDISEHLRLQAEKELVEEQFRQAQKLEAIGTLAGGIAHDFNNILFAILGNAGLARETIPAGNPALESIAQIVESSQRAADLVKQILTFARKTKKRPVAVQVANVVKSVARMLRSTLPTTISITQRLLTQRTTIIADPTEVHQVILNLCTNAGQAMMENGGTLEMSVSNIVISDETSGPPTLPPGEFLVVRVTDTGHGIPDDILPRIFEPFFTTKGTGGTGMGLAVAHGIITSLGGAITVESTVSRGTAFSVYLPLANIEAPEEPASASMLPGGHERILLIDDEPSLTTMLKRSLSSLGYQVSAYNDSLEALAAFQKDPAAFELIITDQTMPRLTGDSLARRMLELTPGLPIILITGYNHSFSAEKIRTLGLAAYLTKPVPMRTLAETIREVLTRRVAGEAK